MSESTTFQSTGALQFTTIAQSGTYDLVAYGAQGGNATEIVASGYQPGTLVTAFAGGLGAVISGDVYLESGTVLEIVVGAEGGTGINAGGGGSSSFIFETSASGLRLELAAGGGGGAGYGSGGSGGGGQASSQGQPGADTGGAGGTGDVAGRTNNQNHAGGGGYTGGASGQDGAMKAISFIGGASAHNTFTTGGFIVSMPGSPGIPSLGIPGTPGFFSTQFPAQPILMGAQADLAAAGLDKAPIPLAAAAMAGVVPAGISRRVVAAAAPISGARPAPTPAVYMPAMARSSLPRSPVSIPARASPRQAAKPWWKIFSPATW